MLLSLIFALAQVAVAPEARSAVAGVAESTVRAVENGAFLSSAYPSRSLSRGEEGRVGFRLTIETDGSIGSCDVTSSSGFDTLDAETCEVMVANARLSPVHNAEGRAVRAQRAGFINWQLPEGVHQATAAPADRTAEADADKIICRRNRKTGSHLGGVRQCMTRREWTEVSRQAQDEMRQMTDNRENVKQD